MNERDKYIFGKPIDIGLTKIRFMTYLEYLDHYYELSVISFNVLHLYYHYKKQFDAMILNQKDKDEVYSSLEEMKKLTLFEIVADDDSIKESYKKILRLLLEDENCIDEIFKDEQLFMNVRYLIMDMQALKEDEVNENEEIQSYIDADRELKSQEAEKQSFIDIASSIAANSGFRYEEIADMTVLQVYSTYYRIGALKSFDATTLFATVSDKVKIESWSKHINLFENEKAGMKLSEFNKKYGNLFGR